MKTVRIWHRQQNEPEHAYAIFRVYLETQGKRTIIGTVEKYAKINAVPITRQAAAGYSINYNWKSRALAFDNWTIRRQEEWIRKRLWKKQVNIAKKRLELREKAIDAALKTTTEISDRSVKGVDVEQLWKNIQTIRQSFDLLGLSRLDADDQLRSISQGSGRRIRSVTAAEEPERLLELPDESYTIQRGSLDPEALLDETDTDLPGSGRPENQDDSCSSG